MCRGSAASLDVSLCIDSECSACRQSCGLMGLLLVHRDTTQHALQADKCDQDGRRQGPGATGRITNPIGLSVCMM